MKDTRIVVSRPDGRPEAYDALPPDGKAKCAMCAFEGDRRDQFYGKNEVFVCSPIDSANGQAQWVCKDHLPDNIVIYDPKTNTCRDKSGENVWTET